jgi:hypothetical protein
MDKKIENIMPPIPGSFANFASVNNSELQTIIDFGFIQPGEKGEPKSGVIIKRIIMPPIVAKELAKILNNAFKNERKK